MILVMVVASPPLIDMGRLDLFRLIGSSCVVVVVLLWPAEDKLAPVARLRKFLLQMQSPTVAV